MAKTQVELLEELAQLLGIEPAYCNVQGQLQKAPPEALLTAIQVMGVPVQKLSDVPNFLHEVKEIQWQRPCEPVQVTWAGNPTQLFLRLPVDFNNKHANCHLKLENGQEKFWSCNLDRLPVLWNKRLGGRTYTGKLLTLPSNLPPGYHYFTLFLLKSSYRTLIIVAPEKAYDFPACTWGVFLPLYALQSQRSWGTGDLTDLQQLLHWTQKLGGGIVGTLPLLATFLDEPFEPSPYAPASRLFWNEFYLDVTRVPEFSNCLPAQKLFISPEFQKELHSFQKTSLVNYRRGINLKRKVLQYMVHYFFSCNSSRRTDFEHWTKTYPLVKDYARFRATTEQKKTGWFEWPDRMQKGILQEGDFDPSVERYHLYVQWLAHQQFKELIKDCPEGSGLYLDLPLGVNRAGYDVWREQSSFALKADCGAPPDEFFTEGQNWGFPPLHPERIRENGYKYYINSLRHNMRYAKILRLDHVMALHRLFWIPQGFSAREGIYVRYQAEEFYAILTLESLRHRTSIVGEDLGTVPRYVRPAMAKHNLNRMYVLSAEFNPNPTKALQPVPAPTMASLNTHDMPPFASFWKHMNLKKRKALSVFLRRKGFLGNKEGIRFVLTGCLSFLASSQARILLINLEDLWLETVAQNAPGKTKEHPNWQRKARYRLETFSQMPGVVDLLKAIDKQRRQIKIHECYFSKKNI